MLLTSSQIGSIKFDFITHGSQVRESDIDRLIDHADEALSEIERLKDELADHKLELSKQLDTTSRLNKTVERLRSVLKKITTTRAFNGRDARIMAAMAEAAMREGDR